MVVVLQMLSLFFHGVTLPVFAESLNEILQGPVGGQAASFEAV
jgi:hypothetical protein